MTVGKVFRRDGISAEGEATMPEFWGTPGEPTKSPTVDATDRSPVPSTLP